MELNQEQQFIINFVQKFSLLLKKERVKEVQILMLQHYFNIYYKKRFNLNSFTENHDREETIGDVLNIENKDKEGIELLKENVIELLSIIDHLNRHNKDRANLIAIFEKFIEKYSNNYLTDNEI